MPRCLDASMPWAWQAGVQRMMRTQFGSKKCGRTMEDAKMCESRSCGTFLHLFLRISQSLVLFLLKCFANNVSPSLSQPASKRASEQQCVLFKNWAAAQKIGRAGERANDGQADQVEVRLEDLDRLAKQPASTQEASSHTACSSSSSCAFLDPPRSFAC